VSVALAPDTPEARYALDTLLHLLGLTSRNADTGVKADISYGSAAGRCRIAAGPPIDWNEPRPLVTRNDGLPIVHLPGGPARVHDGDEAIGFDLLYATYAFLTAPWERSDPADPVGTPIADSGWLAANDLLLEPAVHRYAAILTGALGVGSEARLPDPALVLTHDVDSNFGHLFAVRESRELLHRDLRALRPSSARRAAGLLRRLARRTIRSHDPNDRWQEWADLATANRGRPAYFVAGSGLFDAGADRYDPPYDAAHPEVRETLRRLAADGAEIGVHFSLDARRSVGELRRQRERLEEIVGVPVRSARHHWWALGQPPDPTLLAHAEAGIRVDCSLGFNDRIGFRRGIAYPFRPFDRERREPIPLWELPTHAMDIALFNPQAPREAAAPELAALLAAVRAWGGMLVLNWHGHALNPRVLHGAGDGLRAFLGTLEADPLQALTPLEAADATVDRLSGRRGSSLAHGR
jgi:hypothetical protein